MTRVVVTGLGCLSALGATSLETWAGVKAGKVGTQSTVVSIEGVASPLTAVVAAIQEDVNPKLIQYFGRKPIIAVDRFSNFAAVATLEALEDAGLLGSDDLKSAAIIYGACAGGLVAIDSVYQRLYIPPTASAHPLTVPRSMVSAAASHLSILFGVQGICLTIATACASSAHAVAEGMHLIRSGRAKLVIVGGTEASLTYGNLQSWKALQATSESACRPFSSGRDGTVLGEGAATLILEDEDFAIRRGAKIRCVLAGAGATSDASHMTQPNSKSAAAAVLKAHEDACIDVSQGVLISSHGTGTALNDRSEAAALYEVYGRNLEKSRVIATKSVHGHMLGATGAIEFLLGIRALEDGLAPPIAGYLGRDPDCNLPLVLKPEAIRYRTLVSTSFAFGGLNSALIAHLP